MSLTKSPTFYFWDLILLIEILILIFIRSHREKNFDLYVETLDELMFLFFALDHYNYCRWVSVHTSDMFSLSDHSKSMLKEAWVVQKTMHRYSSIPIDQAHEQENAKVKGNGGIIGLTESPSALKQWPISGPEKYRILTECEQTLFDEVMHHEEGSTYQSTFGKEVKSLVETIEHFGNPFSETSSDLLVLHTQECVDEDVIRSIYSLESIGKEQYKKFNEEVFEKQTKRISDTIKKNNLVLFKISRKMKPAKSSQIQGLKNDVSLFGRLYIANQQREGDFLS